ncbi:MAG: hypothetical protein EPN89_01670 [Methylovulum sp.]|nr:MAG: hypothetical protein EPN89_01670 [Methylovulum sp.]
MEDEATFRQEVRTVCKLYHQAQELHEAGVHVVSIDEKTGIQALERIHPDQAMSKGKLELHEFEYARHGTQTLIIADQLNTHKSVSLVECVAELCGVKTALGEKGKSGILLNMASRAEFLQDTGHRIRFVYTPKHCSWLNQVEIWFGILSRRLLKRGSFTSTEVLNQRILSKS